MDKLKSKYADATIFFLLLSVLIGSTLGGVLAIALFTNLN